MEWDHVQTRLDELTPEMMALPFTAYGHRLLFFDDKALQESRKLLRIKTHKREQQDKRREQVRHFCEIVSTESDQAVLGPRETQGTWPMAGSRSSGRITPRL